MFKQKMKQMDIEGYILSELNPPTEKHYIKGKYKDVYTGYPTKQLSIYDGIRYK